MNNSLMLFINEYVWQDDNGIWRFFNRSFRREGQARKAARIAYRRLKND